MSAGFWDCGWWSNVTQRTLQRMLGDRSTFPHLDAHAEVYFNHASIAPTSNRVHAAAVLALDDYARHGAGAWPIYRDQRERLRGRLAELVGAREDEIGLVPSTSQGASNVALSLPWQRGDRVILLQGEFPANVTPWQSVAETFGLHIDWLRVADFARSSQTGLASLDEALSGGQVRLVAVSAVQFQTGLLMPLRAISERCRAHGAELFVDGIQAVGATPIDVDEMGIDYLVSGSHKWLMAPEGCGFLFVRRSCGERLVPRVAGWLSHDNGTSFLFEGPGHLRYDRPLRRQASVFELGAQNTVGFAALETSVDILLRLGIANIHAHVQGILDAAETTLEAHGFTSVRADDPTARSTIASFRPPSQVDLPTLHEHLASHGIACSFPDGHLRISPHWPNDAAQVERLAHALEHFP